MTDTAASELGSSVPKVVTKVKPATTKSSTSTEKRKRAKNKTTLDANGFPKSLTPEQSTWLDTFNEEYLNTTDRKAFFTRTVKSFIEKFTTCLIENSDKLTKDKVTRHYYNLNNANDGTAGKKATSINKSSIFTFEKKLKKTTALALFTEENREHICTRIAEEREAEDLPTTQNPKLYNQIRSAEYNDLSEEDKEVWVETAENVNELRAAALEMPADEEVIAKNQAELKPVLQQSLERLIGNGHDQIGTKVRFRLRTYLKDTNGQVQSFEINLGKDALGRHFHDTEMFKNEKPNDWKEWAAYSLESETSDLSSTSDSQQASTSGADKNSQNEEEEQPRRPPNHRATSRLVIDDDDDVLDNPKLIVIDDDDGDNGNNSSDASQMPLLPGNPSIPPEKPDHGGPPATSFQPTSAAVPSSEPSTSKVDPLTSGRQSEDSAARATTGASTTSEKNSVSLTHSPLEQGATIDFDPASVQNALPPASETPVNDAQHKSDSIGPENEVTVGPVATPALQANDLGQPLPTVPDLPNDPSNGGTKEIERAAGVVALSKSTGKGKAKSRKRKSDQIDEVPSLATRMTRAATKQIEAESTRKSKRTRRN